MENGGEGSCPVLAEGRMSVRRWYNKRDGDARQRIHRYVPHAAQKRAMEKMYDTKLKIYTQIYM